MPSALLPLIIPQDNFYPAGIVQNDLNNFGPRLGGVYNLTDRTVIRAGFGIYYDNLNLNELQFTRLIPPFAGGYDLSPTGTQLVNVMDMFPDLNTISSPGAVCDEPQQRDRLHAAVEPERAAIAWNRLRPGVARGAG
jgi:hypothetical protein